MEACYLTLLGTENYLPGVLGLLRSLRRTGTTLPLVCLVVEGLPPACRERLEGERVECVTVPPIAHPYAHRLSAEERYKSGNYTKLHIFNFTRARKVVYVDADMVVLENLDHLFDRPHMTACAARQEHNPSWTHLNSGLLVVEPSVALFRDMLDRIGKVEEPSSEGGDQQFLHGYFADWSAKPQLHLPQRYNYLVNEEQMPTGPVYVAHFVGSPKPWRGGGNVFLWYFLAFALPDHQEETNDG